MRFGVTAGDGTPLTGRVVVTDAVTERPMARAVVRGTEWTLGIPRQWPSSLYVARFHDDRPEEPEPERNAEHEVWFVVRAARPAATSSVLVSIPFATWRAYHRAGQPGRSLYHAEEPGRAARVSFTDPGGGPPPERWEEPLLRWLPGAGYPVEFCSGLDLDDGGELLSSYRLLVVNGHDEYWSAGMRDSVETFARKGGNLAFFAGNTAWWQMRLEDGAARWSATATPRPTPSAPWTRAAPPSSGPARPSTAPRTR